VEGKKIFLRASYESVWIDGSIAQLMFGPRYQMENYGQFYALPLYQQVNCPWKTLTRRLCWPQFPIERVERKSPLILPGNALGTPGILVRTLVPVGYP